MSFSDRHQIIIIGAGIRGITTPCILLQGCSLRNNLKLIIISEKFSSETTGNISAG